jgi:hypothetical protein
VFTAFVDLVHQATASKDNVFHVFLLNEAHRLILDRSSDLDPNNMHSENCGDDGNCAMFLDVGGSFGNFPKQLSVCLRELTRADPQQGSWSPVELATRRTVHTVYVALDQLRRYISTKPYEEGGNYEIGGILFNAILEMSGLPCLPVDFAGDRWEGYTQLALDGDMGPLMVNVLNELIRGLAMS